MPDFMKFIYIDFFIDINNNGGHHARVMRSCFRPLYIELKNTIEKGIEFLCRYKK
jgi:hypothetical protein